MYVISIWIHRHEETELQMKLVSLDLNTFAISQRLPIHFYVVFTRILSSNTISLINHTNCTCRPLYALLESFIYGPQHNTFPTRTCFRLALRQHALPPRQID